VIELLLLVDITPQNYSQKYFNNSATEQCKIRDFVSPVFDPIELYGIRSSFLLYSVCNSELFKTEFTWNWLWLATHSLYQSHWSDSFIGRAEVMRESCVPHFCTGLAIWMYLENTYVDACMVNVEMTSLGIEPKFLHVLASLSCRAQARAHYVLPWSFGVLFYTKQKACCYNMVIFR
jgi:hypothetical protein